MWREGLPRRAAWLVVMVAAGCQTTAPIGPGGDMGAGDAAARCSGDTSCKAPTPRCDAKTGRCVGCASDSHCPDGTLCTAGACVPGCSASRGCGDAGVCDVDAGTCRSCAGDQDCADPTPRCDVAAMRCVPCLPQSDNCPAGRFCTRVNDAYACSQGCKVDADCRGDGGAGACCANLCVDTAANNAHCGACGAFCPMGSSCCAAACNDFASDPKNCGACGKVCALPNATPACMAGACAVGACAGAFADCDQMPGNGCEVDTNADPANCLGCGKVCALPNAMAGCKGGCVVAGCAMGFGDCDMSPGNGCEIDLGSDVRHCGGCGMACPAVVNATAGCAGGKCQVASCNGAFRDCDKAFQNGCEVDTNSDVSHCGGCGVACPAVLNAVRGCKGGVCGIASCAAPFQDCDNNAGNGCEMNTALDVGNCGGCGRACPAVANGSRGCSGGACTVAGCNAPFADCDKVVGNGCEIDTRTDPRHCGACGMTCALANATAGCAGGQCTVAMCNAGFANCDGNAANGCEANLATSASHCGACGKACPQGSTCAAGSCTPPIDNTLVAYYNLDDAGPAIRDGSANGNHGTVRNATRVPGKRGFAYSVDNGACITIPDSPSLQMVGGQALTMMAWIVYRGGCASDRGIVINKESTYEMGPQCGGTPFFQEAIQLSDGNWFWSGTRPINMNNWHHLAVTWDGATVRQYLDGAQTDSRALAGQFAARATGLGIGCRSVPPDGSFAGAGSFFIGVIDEVAIYRRALPQGEIQAYYNATR